jgi:phosphatidylglycerol:prolipoprotein diacylglycerol transferase
MVLMIPYRLPWLRTLDGLFCVSLAYGIGRVGCFLAGDGDYGIPSRVPWAMSFPRGVLPTLARVHPTMLYCTVWELALFAILWKVSSAQSTTPLRPGTLLSLYLIATSMGRFLIEFLSRNRTVAFGLTEAQLMSIALFLAGTTILILVSIEKAGVGGSIPSLATITASPRNAPEYGHSCPVDGADI